MDEPNSVNASAPVKGSSSRRPMTGLELEAVQCLDQVRYPVASWDKRFSRSMSGRTMITDKEMPQVWRLLKRYRRQIKHANKRGLLEAAEMFAAPDYRKEQAMQRERERYTQAMQNAGTQRPGSPDGSLATETRKPGSLK